jgi:hypothetical protein
MADTVAGAAGVEATASGVGVAMAAGVAPISEVWAAVSTWEAGPLTVADQTFTWEPCTSRTAVALIIMAALTSPER